MTHKFYIDETNSDFGPVVRWIESDNIPFMDKLLEFRNAGYIDQQIVDNSQAARKIEQAASIKEYVEFRKQYGYSEEERFEMACAFSEGEEVVDIFTGETIRI